MAEQPENGNTEYVYTPNPDHEPSVALREAASWRLTAELVDRYWDRFMVIETHPAGGSYDCLTLVPYEAPDSPEGLFDLDENDPSVSHIDLNRVGSVWVHRRDQTHWVWRGCWWEVAAADELGPLLDRLSFHAGLPASESRPEPTHAVVAYRVIAAILTHQILSPVRWTCRNGYLDGSGMGGGRRDELFERFPEARERLRHVDISDLFEQPAYRFWFLLKGDDPALAIEPAAGLAWDTRGRRIDLYAKYQKTHRIWAVLWSAAGHLLP